MPNTPVLFLYDAHCTILWISRTESPYRVRDVIGTLAWDRMEDGDARACQAAFMRCQSSKGVVHFDCDVRHLGVWRLWLHFVRMRTVRFVGTALKIPDEVLLLTARQRQVCAAIADGNSSKLAAKQLGVSRSTIDNHRRQIAAKLHVATAALAAWCGKNIAWLD